jgi:hypothetical protein
MLDCVAFTIPILFLHPQKEWIRAHEMVETARA